MKDDRESNVEFVVHENRTKTSAEPGTRLNSRAWINWHSGLAAWTVCGDTVFFVNMKGTRSRVEGD